MNLDSYRSMIQGKVARGVDPDDLRKSVRRFLPQEEIQLLGPPRRATMKPADCVHLGKELPGEVGECKTKLRWCSVFGTCTYCPSEKSKNHCTDGNLNIACLSYEKE